MPPRYKSLALFLLVLGLSAYVIFYLRLALLVVIGAAVVAIMIDPAVERLHRTRIMRWTPSRGAAVGLLAIAVLIAVGLLSWLIVPRVIGEASELRHELPQRLSELAYRFGNNVPFVGRLNSQDLRQKARSIFQSENVTSNPVDLFVGIGSALLLAVYFSAEKSSVVGWMVSLVPVGGRERFAATANRGARRMQHWLAGQMLLMLIHGCSALAVFWVLHLRFFYVLAIFAGLINIIPVVGPILTVIVAGTVAAISSLGKLVAVVIFFIVYHNVENIVLTPRIMKAKLQIPASTVIAALIVGDVLAGFVGMLLAVPSAVLIAVFVDEYVISRDSAVPDAAGSDLRMRKAS